MTGPRAIEEADRPGGEGSPEADQPRTRVDLTSAISGPAWRVYLKALGPGLVTGASDDDPSGIATYSQAGAQFGFALLWSALITLPLMAAVQEICDRTALATGSSLGELVTKRFRSWGRWVVAVLIAALIVANVMNIAADLVAIGAGMHLLHAGPGWPWALVAGLTITAFIVRGSFTAIARVFKLVCLALLAYLVELAVVKVPWGQVGLNTVLPHVQLTKDYVSLLVAVLGTTISPYLFFWQTVHRVEEMRDEPEGGRRPLPLARRSKAGARNKESTSRFDVFSGMAVSNLVMFVIIVIAAATLGAHGRHTIAGPDQAAAALRPIAGRFASSLFALGFIGSGMLAVPVLAGAGAAGMAGLLGKRAGFSRKFREAPVFYSLVAVGTLGGAAISLIGVNPIRLLVFVAALNGVAAAPFLVLVMIISGNRAIMKGQVNGKLAMTLGARRGSWPPPPSPSSPPGASEGTPAAPSQADGDAAQGDRT
jgi:NRAMP (natural resistance-associated macrophage protein)-like metal ion transporter